MVDFEGIAGSREVDNGLVIYYVVEATDSYYDFRILNVITVTLDEVAKETGIHNGLRCSEPNLIEDSGLVRSLKGAGGDVLLILSYA